MHILHQLLCPLFGAKMKLSADGKNFSNLTREEISALNDLKSDRRIVIKESDKRSGVVVWYREDYRLLNGYFQRRKVKLIIP